MTDESYIKLTLEIAKKGAGRVSPNPMVGCIIIKENKVIGAGFHEYFGGPHAEINAIESATESVKGAVLYVNLEPCSHFGKTPPCVDRIIAEGIKKVVIGTLDMNPLVSGQGARKLKAAGIEVKTGVLEKECIQLNKFFFKYITKNFPYITLKAAQTLDGKIADLNRNSKWITATSARRAVHEMRTKYDAVLVGSGTVRHDNPNLTVRLTEGRNPKRVFVDSKLSFNCKLNLLKNTTQENVFIITSKESRKKVKKVTQLEETGVNIIYVDKNSFGKLNLKAAFKELAKRGIASVLVEGGSGIFTSLIQEKMFDDILLFISPKLLGPGLPMVGNIGIKSVRDALKLKIENFEKAGDDLLIELVK